MIAQNQNGMLGKYQPSNIRATTLLEVQTSEALAVALDDTVSRSGKTFAVQPQASAHEIDPVSTN